MKKNHEGTAIIIALFIMALIAVTAIAMLQRFSIDMRRSELILRSNQSYFYAQGSIAWAVEQLNQAWYNQKPNQVIDNKSPIIFPTSEEKPYLISASLTDAQGQLNINNLTDSEYQFIFSKLMRTLSPNLSEAAAFEIAKAVVDWITPGLKETPFDQYYSKQNPPYRSAHSPMASISEMLLVKGMTPDLFTKLEPYLCALPTTTPININSASIPIIESLSKPMTLDTAKQIYLLIQQAPFSDLQKFLNLDVIKSNRITASKLTTTSSYFLLKTNVTVQNQQLILYTLLNRVPTQKGSRTLIVWQSRGTL